MTTQIAKVAAACCVGVLAVACGSQSSNQGAPVNSTIAPTSVAQSTAVTAVEGSAANEAGSTTVVYTTEPAGETSTVRTTVSATEAPTTSADIPGPYRQGPERLENQLLPAGVRPVNETAKLAPWQHDDFALLYANESASDAFAFAVHNRFMATDPNPNTSTGGSVFEVHSPTTGENYRVTCVQGPKFTTCSTETGATIYII